MSRVVVAAPYPAMPGPESLATLRLVRTLVADGDEVTVVSPVPSAAHEWAQYAGARGSIRLARLAAKADVLHLRIDVDAMFHDRRSLRLLVGRLVLSVLLRRVGRSVLRLDRVPAPIDPRFARLVVEPATSVLVSSERERSALVAAGVSGGKLTVDPDLPLPAPSAEEASPPRPRMEVPDGASPSELQQLLQERAAAERAARRRQARPDEGAASLPLRHLTRLERTEARSAKPGGAVVKRLLVKVLAWQIDPIHAAVNALHQATIDAVDTLDARQSGEDTSA